MRPSAGAARRIQAAELAETLTPSEATVKTHVARIFAKLGLRDRAQAVVIAYETGTHPYRKPVVPLIIPR
ncbi:response regulator transcription factor [Sphaerimonospora cavernae]|uniref:response regulator transcription factor n=1 Tax=Sphaerimonospora cavernae TaxID=1740611 RepID=UPI00406C9DAD